jgi:4-hydroxythreonine-4-phosphate dehydrogenase
MEIAGTEFDVRVVDDPERVGDEADTISILHSDGVDGAKVRMGELDRESGAATVADLYRGLDLCREGKIGGLVFAPLNKAAMKLGGYDFQDDMTLMSDYLGWEEHYGEINVVQGLWTTRVTSHIPVKDIAASLTVEGIMNEFTLAHQAMVRAGYKNPRIVAAALNPHAGESGTCGREEIDIIAPAVEKAKQRGINAFGPHSADTVFLRAFQGEFDGVVTMYHDQGQIAIKLNHFDEGVTVAGGLPYPIATPAHGTAFDIAGKGVAKTTAFELAVRIASSMAAGGDWDYR